MTWPEIHYPKKQLHGAHRPLTQTLLLDERQTSLVLPLTIRWTRVRLAWSLLLNISGTVRLVLFACTLMIRRLGALNRYLRLVGAVVLPVPIPRSIPGSPALINTLKEVPPVIHLGMEMILKLCVALLTTLRLCSLHGQVV